MVGTDASRDRQFEVPGLRHSLGGQVGRPERLRDHHVRIPELAFEDGVRSVLVGGDNELVPACLEKLAQSKLAGNAPEQLPRLKIDRAGCRQRLPVRIAFDLRKIVARVAFGIAAARVVVENAENLRHEGTFLQ